jgi:DNA-binding Lrp family transcriptional regulator
VESVVLDELDRGLVHALEVDGRAPFGRVAEVLGVSDQTVARRYRRLRTAGVLRVVGSVDATRLGYTSWTIRMRCAPDVAGPIATVLAKRSDTFWVHVLSGGTEIACGTTARTAQERGALLLQRLPRTSRISSVTAHSQLHLFVGGRVGWPGAAEALSEEQVERLRPDPLPPAGDGPVVLDDGDRVLLAALSLDGRTGHAELAGVTGWSESTVRRRMDRLAAGGVLYYDVDILPEALGYHTEARLWMSVRPAELASVGRALAGHVEISFAAATTGPTNLMAGVLCRDDQALYRYLTERIGALEGVERLETAPVIRTIKRAGTVLKP